LPQLIKEASNQFSQSIDWLVDCLIHKLLALCRAGSHRVNSFVNQAIGLLLSWWHVILPHTI